MPWMSWRDRFVRLGWALMAVLLSCGGRAGSDTGGETGSAGAGLGGLPGASTAVVGAGDTGGATQGGAAVGGGAELGMPRCLVKRGTPCGADVPQTCYLPCGAEMLGFRRLYCDGGFYVEETGCSFLDDRDYSCFRIPAEQDASCPSDRDTPQAGEPCALPLCTVCAGDYLDQSSAPRVGFCTCDVAGSTGTRWACGVQGTWPCPGHKGC
jgi:hypothetical protein